MEVVGNLREYLIYCLDAVGSEENPSKANEVEGEDTSDRLANGISFDMGSVFRIEDGAPSFV